MADLTCFDLSGGNEQRLPFICCGGVVSLL